MAKTSKPTASAKMDKEMAMHMAESDLRTMIEAEKIRKDKPRHAAAMQKHKELMEAMQAMGMHGKGGMAGKGKMGRGKMDDE